MEKITYYLRMLCIVCCANYTMQTSVAAFSDSMPMSLNGIAKIARAVFKNGQNPPPTLDYGPSLGRRIIHALAILTLPVALLLEPIMPDPIKPLRFLKGKGFTEIVIKSFTTLIGLYGVLLAFLNTSSIVPGNRGLLLPTYCLKRGFFGRLLYYLLPAAFADLDPIDYSQIAYADLKSRRETVSSQEETLGEKKVWGDIRLQHTHKTGTKKDVFNHTLVIYLKGHRRCYVIREDYCRKHGNDFQILVGLLIHKGILVVEDKNY